MKNQFLTIRATKTVTSILCYIPETQSYHIHELKFASDETLPVVLQKIKETIIELIKEKEIQTIYIKDITPGSLGIDPERYMIHGVLIQSSYEAGVKNILFRKKSTIKSIYQNNKHFVELFGKEFKFDLDNYAKSATELKEFSSKIFPGINIDNIKNNNTRETYLTSLCGFLENMEVISTKKKKN